MGKKPILNNTKTFLSEVVDPVKAAGLYSYFNPLSSMVGPEMDMYFDGEILKGVVMMGSNNYLGLTNDKRVIEAGEKALRKYGSGCTGSMFLNGTLDIHIELQETLAKATGNKAALLSSTGFYANSGTIPAIVGRNDVVVTDTLDHASITTGRRISFGKKFNFKHNDMGDLECKLKRSKDLSDNILVVVEGVYSMHGDIGKLPEISKLCDQYGAALMVDEAHSIGVLGERGMGATELYGLENEVDIYMATFSKSLASIGGFIAGDKDTIEFVKHRSTPVMFSASLPPASVAIVLKALELNQKENWRRENLMENSKRLKEGLVSLGYDTGDSSTPIVPVNVGEQMLTLQLGRDLLKSEKVFTNPVVWPAVSKEDGRLRLSCMATHTSEQIDYVIEAFERAGKKLGVI
ncbi:8-amino-7-oxononanoate synthase [archaeon]|nr:8-amino-7-oxononanoate synthase [archaeon]